MIDSPMQASIVQGIEWFRDSTMPFAVLFGPRLVATTTQSYPPTLFETKQTKSKDLYEKTNIGKPYSEMSNDIRTKKKKKKEKRDTCTWGLSTLIR